MWSRSQSQFFLKLREGGKKMKLNYEETRKEISEKSNKMMQWGFMILVLVALVLLVTIALGVIPAERWLDALS